MDRNVLIDQLKEHEGLRFRPYLCSAGKLTIGIGRNLEARGVTEEEALFLLGNDISRCILDLEKIFGSHFGTLPEIAQRVIIGMRFNLGAKGFRGFKNFIAAIKESDFKKAKLEMIDSLWYGQVKGRGKTLVKMMDKCC